MKRFKKEDVFSWANCEEAIQYIDLKGYFADNIQELKRDVERRNGAYYELVEIRPEYEVSHVFRPRGCEIAYGLFLPVDRVKEVQEEKKWRAFKNSKELADTLGVETESLLGSKITWRNKGTIRTVGQSLIINVFSNNGESCISLGFVNYSMEKSFFELELNKDGVWQPFGVKEC